MQLDSPIHILMEDSCQIVKIMIQKVMCSADLYTAMVCGVMVYVPEA